MIVDVNASLGQWPFRRLPCDELPKFLERLARHGVRQAWVASFDGLFHRDVEGVNARLAALSKQQKPGLLIPFGTVNPTLPDWREDLRRCHREHGMAGIRLHSNYHGYRLTDPAFAELLALAEKRGLVVQLALRMEDVRAQHPLMRVPDVDAKSLAKLIGARPDLRLVLLNWQGSLAGL